MGAVNRVMIGPADTVGLHVTTTGYEESQQWGGRGGKVFDREHLKSLDWVASVLPHPFPALSRHALDLVYTKDSLCSISYTIGLGFESQSRFLFLDSVTLVSVIVTHFT